MGFYDNDEKDERMHNFNKYEVICIIIACICSFLIITYNAFVNLDEDVNLQYYNLQAQLQRRMDLITNLVTTVKEYENHEEAIFTEIAEARYLLESSINNGNLAEIASANDVLNVSLNKLTSLAGDNPELKSSEQFISLMDEIAGTENRITFARQHYNEAVQNYNRKIRKFPWRIYAAIFGFDQKPYFEADESAQSAPIIDFN